MTGTIPQANSSRKTYKIEERYTAPDSFKIQDASTKELVYEIKGKLVSFHGNKKMLDAKGNILFSMVADSISRDYRMVLKDHRTNNIYFVKKKGLLKGRGTLQVFLGTDETASPIHEITTNLSRSDSNIKSTRTGELLANIQRKTLTAKRLFSGLDSYIVRVEPESNAELMIMLTVCFDEQYTEGAF